VAAATSAWGPRAGIVWSYLFIVQTLPSFTSDSPIPQLFIEGGTPAPEPKASFTLTAVANATDRERTGRRVGTWTLNLDKLLGPIPSVQAIYASLRVPQRDLRLDAVRRVGDLAEER
jgi:hypothetical protein